MPYTTTDHKHTDSGTAMPGSPLRCEGCGAISFAAHDDALYHGACMGEARRFGGIITGYGPARLTIDHATMWPIAWVCDLDGEITLEAD